MSRRHGNAAVRHVWEIANKTSLDHGPRGLQLYNNRTYFALREDWLQKPGVPGDLVLADASGGAGPNAAAFLAAMIANRDFEVVGTNAVTADVTFRTGGGILLTSHGSTNDSTIVAPNLNTAMTQWAVANNWKTDKEASCEAVIETGSSIAAQTFWYGLKKTNTPVITTDTDQFMFRFDTTSTLGAANLHFITSRTNVDTDDILPVAIAASTQYRLRCELDANLKPLIWVNGVNLTNTLSTAGQAALTSAVSLIPYVGILQTGSGAKTLGVLPGYEIGRRNAA